MDEEVRKQYQIELATWKRRRRWREKQPPEKQAYLAEIARNPPYVDYERLEQARKDYSDLEATVEQRKRLHVESRLSTDPGSLKIRYDSALEANSTGLS
jgi:hypothetical protein